MYKFVFLHASECKHWGGCMPVVGVDIYLFQTNTAARTARYTHHDTYNFHSIIPIAVRQQWHARLEKEHTTKFYLKACG